MKERRAKFSDERYLHMDIPHVKVGMIRWKEKIGRILLVHFIQYTLKYCTKEKRLCTYNTRRKIENQTAKNNNKCWQQKNANQLPPC